MDRNWYALAVQPRKENFVERQLRSMGYEVVCPRFRKLIRHARSTKSVAAPIFPSYLFIALNAAAQSWRNVNWVPGSIGLIKFDNRPTPLPIDFVDQFISNLGKDGIVEFQQRLEVGEKIEAVGGPFDRFTGEIIEMSGDDRVKVLMDSLNRKVEVSLPRTAVFAVT
ncbi:MAG: transcription termination/antitermination NusG family protein [Pseudomonadota bacterium]